MAGKNSEIAAPMSLLAFDRKRSLFVTLDMSIFMYDEFYEMTLKFASLKMERNFVIISNRSQNSHAVFVYNNWAILDCNLKSECTKKKLGR